MTVNKLLKDKYTISLLGLGTLLIIIGTILICCKENTSGTDYVVDYTYCMNEEDPDMMCLNGTIPKDKACNCFASFNISTPISAPVSLYYQLDSYFQSDYAYSQSRDNEQLRGNLKNAPSKQCGEYSYNNEKPIAPCGAVADSMFNDIYVLYSSDYKDVVPILYTDLDGITAEDKTNYHNPPGDLKKAFEKFAKPKNWNINIWELGADNPNNTGFQNERFIGWMKTDVQRKPFARINHKDKYTNSVPNGSYYFRITYNYPYSRYNGKRLIILSNKHITVNTVMVWFGSIFIVGGLLTIIARVAYIVGVYKGYIQSNNPQTVQ